MVDSTDLEAAVRSGVVPADVADRLRNFSAERRHAPGADEERFGAIGGFSDVMSAVGMTLVFGVAVIMGFAISPLTFALLPPLLWLLAEYFTRKRHLTLTSFVLFTLFTLTCAMALLGVALFLPGGGSTMRLPSAAALPPLPGLVIAAGSAMACAAWWLRFRFPFAYAVAVVAAINVTTHVLRMAAPGTPAALVSIYLLLCGLALLAIAIFWDMSDIRRETSRADVAFWVHAAAGYQIAGASYRLIFGVQGDPVGWGRLYTFATLPPQPIGAVIALLTFACFCGIALALDRRSLMMSSLVFIVPALARLSGLQGPAAWLAGAAGLGVLLIGFSIAWTPLRAAVLRLLPLAMRAQLPRTGLVQAGSRPVR